MSKVVYRAILHGPMTWKTTHQSSDSNSSTPYLVIFEPNSSVVILSQGTLLIPNISIFLNKLKSQILSVFVYNDPFTAKQLVSELYNYLDKNLTIFDVYKNDKALKLLSKSLASFHLPLEVVLKRVDCGSGTRLISRDVNNVSANNLKNGFRTNSYNTNTQDHKNFPSLKMEYGTHNFKVSNTVTNNLLNYNYDGVNNFYNDEPKSVKSSNERMDSYNLRVGLEEGFYVLTSSTDLMQKLFQSLERKGARVNRLSLNFYRISKPDYQLEMNIQTNTVINRAKSLLNETKTNPNKVLLQNKQPTSYKDLTTNYYNKGLPKFSKNPGFYTPGLLTSPLLAAQHNYQNDSLGNMVKEVVQLDDKGYDNKLGQPALKNILRSLTTAIDKNTEALNMYGTGSRPSGNFSYTTETNFSKEANFDFKEAKKEENPPLVHGLASMSTHEFYGYGSPSITNSNNFNNAENKNYPLVSDGSSDQQFYTMDKSRSFSDVKLDDLKVGPFSSDIENYFNETKEPAPENIQPETKTQEEPSYEHFVKNYLEVLQKMSEVEQIYDLSAVKRQFMEQKNQSQQNEQQDSNPIEVQNEQKEVPEVNDQPKLSSRTNEKSENSFVDTDSLSDFSDYSDDEEEKQEPKEEAKELQKLNASNNTEKSTTFRDDEVYKSELESTDSGELSENSNLNVLLDEFNQLSNKNELLSKDVSKYRNKITKLKEKINNMKALHKYELEEVMNNSFSNEQKLRNTINENNVTMKMMEQERLKLTEMLEQHKMTVKRVNREKVDTYQQLSRLEDEYNKLQMVREMDKNDKYTFNKTKVELEQLKSENEALSNKLRTATEKLQSFEHSDKVKDEVMSELKEKVEQLDSDRIKNVQLTTENKVLKNKELHLKEKYEQVKKDHIALRSEVSLEKANNYKLTQLNQELLEELKSTKSLLAEYQAKDNKLESKMSMLESNNTVLLKNLEASKSELQRVKKVLETANNDKNKLDTKYQQLQSSVEKVESMNQSLSLELSGLRKSFEEKERDNKKLTSLVSEKDKELENVKNQNKLVKDSHNQLLRDHNYLRTSYEAMEISLKKFKKFDEGLRHEYQLKSDENEDLLRQLHTFKYCMEKFKSDLEAESARQKDMYVKLVSRMFWLAYSYNKLKRENSINKIRVTMMAHKNNSVLSRSLIRTVLLSKAKVAKRNCQLLKIVGALQMSGPTTCSMIISRINSLVASSAENNSLTQDKLTQLKSSFMKHSMEKDQKIKVLQSQLISLDQMKDNQQFLLEENRNLTEQLMVEQNNSQKLQQALNEQLERERFAFESESKSLYNRQYQLLKDNEQLSKENYGLKESLATLLKHQNSAVDQSYHTSNFTNNLLDAKYARLRTISNSKGSIDGTQTHYSPPYLNSPNKFKYSEFGENLPYNGGDQYPRAVYHQA